MANLLGSTLFKNVKNADVYLSTGVGRAMHFLPGEEKYGDQTMFRFTSAVATGDSIVLERVSGDAYTALVQPAIFGEMADNLEDEDKRKLVEFMQSVLFGGRIKAVVKQYLGLHEFNATATVTEPPGTSQDGLYLDPLTTRIWKVVSTTVTEITGISSSSSSSTSSSSTSSSSSSSSTSSTSSSSSTSS